MRERQKGGQEFNRHWRKAVARGRKKGRWLQNALSSGRGECCRKRNPIKSNRPNRRETSRKKTGPSRGRWRPSRSFFNDELNREFKMDIQEREARIGGKRGVANFGEKITKRKIGASY